MPTIDFSEGLIWYFVFLYSTVAHEAGHAWAARLLGDSTAYEGGQVSFDPTPHLRREPFGMVVVPILSFFLGGWMIGWASAPFDEEWAERFPRRAAWMALAGPAVNFLLLAASFGCLRIGWHFQVFQEPQTVDFTHLVKAVGGPFWEFAATLLSVAFWLNLIQVVFNLLPFPPLDGSNLPYFFLGPSAALEYRRVAGTPFFRLLGLLAAFSGFYVIFPPVEHAVINFVYPGIQFV